MCDTVDVRFLVNGRAYSFLCDTVRDFEYYLKVKAIVNPAYASDFEPQPLDCLCCVDIPETAKEAGFECEARLVEPGIGDYVLAKEVESIETLISSC